jgi:hypothetical protein
MKTHKTLTRAIPKQRFVFIGFFLIAFSSCGFYVFNMIYQSVQDNRGVSKNIILPCDKTLSLEKLKGIKTKQLDGQGSKYASFVSVLTSNCLGITVATVYTTQRTNQANGDFVGGVDSSQFEFDAVPKNPSLFIYLETEQSTVRDANFARLFGFLEHHFKTQDLYFSVYYSQTLRHEYWRFSRRLGLILDSKHIFSFRNLEANFLKQALNGSSFFTYLSGFYRVQIDIERGSDCRFVIGKSCSGYSRIGIILSRKQSKVPIQFIDLQNSHWLYFFAWFCQDIAQKNNLGNYKKCELSQSDFEPTDAGYKNEISLFFSFPSSSIDHFLNEFKKTGNIKVKKDFFGQSEMEIIHRFIRW